MGMSGMLCINTGVLSYGNSGTILASSASALIVDTITYSPSLMVSKTSSGVLPNYTGQTISYILSITNTGTTGANAIQMIEYYPSGFVYSGYNGSGSYSSYGTTGLWTVASLLAGETAQLILYGSFNSTGMKTNTVSITGANTAYCYGSTCNASHSTVISDYIPYTLNGQCNPLIQGQTYYTGNIQPSITGILCSSGTLSGLVQGST